MFPGVCARVPIVFLDTRTYTRRTYRFSCSHRELALPSPIAVCGFINSGTPQAFTHDEMAASLSLEVISKGWDTSDAKNYTFLQRMFVYLPLQHSEKLEIQVKKKKNRV